MILPTLLTLFVMTSSCYGVKVIDLTHVMKEGESITWPVNPRYNFSILHRGLAPIYQNVWLENNKFMAPEHGGTHMDAPSHFTKGGWRMHQVPVSRLVGEGVVIDMRAKVKGNDMYKLTIDDVKEWESEHGKIPDKAMVLVNGGWSVRYPDWNRVFNSDNLQDLNSFKYPSVSLKAANWLVDERNILALGMDTPSPELMRNFELPMHTALLPKNVLILENVANLNSLPPKGITIVLGALNLYDGSGAPMRMLALSGGWRCQTTAVGLAGVLSLGLLMGRLLVR